MTRAMVPLLLASTLFHPDGAHAAVVTLEPTIDGTQRRTGFPFPTFTYFTGDAFVRASFSQTTNHANVSVEENYLAMEFDLSSVPVGNTVTSASLSWTELSDFLSPGNIHPLKGYVGDGLFTVSDFAGGADLGQVASGTSDGRVSFDVTAFAAARVAASNRYAGFSVLNGGYYQQSIGMFGTYTTVGEYRIGSRLAIPDSRPRLVLTFVPEIGAFSFASVSALGLFVVRQYRSRLGKGCFSQPS